MGHVAAQYPRGDHRLGGRNQVNESKIALTERLRREGRWAEASKFKDEAVKKLRAGGMRRAEAREEAWEKMAEAFPPPPTPRQPEHPDAAGNAEERQATTGVLDHGCLERDRLKESAFYQHFYTLPAHAPTRVEMDWIISHPRLMQLMRSHARKRAMVEQAALAGGHSRRREPQGRTLQGCRHQAAMLPTLSGGTGQAHGQGSLAAAPGRQQRRRGCART